MKKFTIIRQRVMTVRARQKRLADIPTSFVCCDSIRDIYRAQDITGVECEVVPSTVFLAEVECRFCHAVRDNVKYMRTVRPFQSGGTKGAIPVDCYEFDEGQSARSAR